MPASQPGRTDWVFFRSIAHKRTSCWLLCLWKMETVITEAYESRRPKRQITIFIFCVPAWDGAAVSRRVLFLHRSLMLPVGSHTKQLRLPLSRFLILSGGGGKIKRMCTRRSSFLSALLKGSVAQRDLTRKGKGWGGFGTPSSLVTGFVR